MHEHEREIGRRDAAYPAGLAERARADAIELLARLRAEVPHAGVVEALGDRPLGVPPVRPDSQRSSAGASSHRSKSAGVWRKSGTCSWSHTFTPPITTRDSATFSSSVVVGT